MSTQSKRDLEGVIMIKKSRTALKFGVFLMAFLLISWMPGEDGKLHFQAKKFIQQRKWEKAIQTYQSLLENHPASFYCDNALFWIGFSWEQLEGNGKNAFESYTRLITGYPESAWVDDATIHQISLAKKFILKGDRTFENFLHEKLNSSDTTIRYQSALALGDLKDPAAVPLLEEMVQSPDENLAKMAMQKLEGYSITLEQTIETEIESIRKMERKAKETTPDLITQNLRKKGEKWTKDELILNGLFHILPEEDLTFYLSLENEWDRKEWWHKFWASQDPTPTTSENEAEQEFIRRVEYVRENFEKDWSFSNGYYPPWDSRGELYIKFGAPSRREKLEPGWEKWTYYRYKISFIVSSQKSNISGQGISFSGLSRYLYRHYTPLHQSRLIQKNQFLYADPVLEQSKKIKGMELQLQSVQPAGTMLLVRIEYSYPAANLKFNNEDDMYKGAHHCYWALYDEDYNTLSADDAIEEFFYSDKKEMKNNCISGSLEFTVPTGSYVLGLKIKDVYSKRMGLYRKHFSTQNH
jgi:GWxTD domain-containing protein